MRLCVRGSISMHQLWIPHRLFEVQKSFGELQWVVQTVAQEVKFRVYRTCTKLPLYPPTPTVYPSHLLRLHQGGP